MNKMAKTPRKSKGARSSKTPSIMSSDIVDQYIHHHEKRSYNPPVGLVTPETDKEMPKRRYEYDPHLDPQLQWAGKKEHTSFEVDTVSLHVHERIDPLTIIEKAVKKQETVQQTLFHYFEQPVNNPPLREAIDFYKHNQNWANRLIAGDSLHIMNSLLQKEGMAGKVQMIYIDPPYGIKYSSNFQPFVEKRDVRENDEDLTQEPEMVRAFRDTWELGIHSYLSYLRERLFLARELLSESGSIFVQISDENIHLVRVLLDEVFGTKNFCSLITFRKKMMPLGSDVAEAVSDYIIWYAKNRENLKSRPIFKTKQAEGDTSWAHVELPDGRRRRLTKDEILNHKLLPPGSRVFQSISMLPAQYRPNQDFPFEYEGKIYYPPKRSCWKTDKHGMEQLAKLKRLIPSGDTLRYILYHNDYPVSRITNLWDDTSGADDPIYVVQTNTRVVERCILMATDPGDLIFDPSCGSGTTAFVAEQWGRRWITCDTSRVALALAKQRMMTSVFDYYELAQPEEDVSSGYNYRKVPHVTLGSIANNQTRQEETLYDQPIIDRSKSRVTGPFTVEALPAPVITPIDNLDEVTASYADASIARAGETIRQDEWRKELLATGILGRRGEKISFSRVEPLQGTEWLHADAETKEPQPRRVVISFGSDYMPLEQRQVARAIEESQTIVPQPKIIIFAAFQFDPEAAKDIDELKWSGVTVIRVQMNMDLLTEDLKKKVSKSQSFWLMGQPDIELKKSNDGKYIVEVHGFDYYNTKTHEIESGDASRVAMWMLDPDYDGRSLYPQQIFFPLAGDSNGWTRIGKSIRAHIDETLLEKFHGTLSLPFELGPNKRIAVKIIDDRGVESLRILKAK